MLQSKQSKQSSRNSLFPDWDPLRSAFVAKLGFMLSLAYEGKQTVGRFKS